MAERAARGFSCAVKNASLVAGVRFVASLENAAATWSVLLFPPACWSLLLLALLPFSRLPRYFPPRLSVPFVFFLYFGFRTGATLWSGAGPVLDRIYPVALQFRRSSPFVLPPACVVACPLSFLAVLRGACRGLLRLFIGRAPFGYRARGLGCPRRERERTRVSPAQSRSLPAATFFFALPAELSRQPTRSLFACLCSWPQSFIYFGCTPPALAAL